MSLTICYKLNTKYKPVSQTLSQQLGSSIPACKVGTQRQKPSPWRKCSYPQDKVQGERTP